MAKHFKKMPETDGPGWEGDNPYAAGYSAGSAGNYNYVDETFAAGSHAGYGDGSYEAGWDASGWGAPAQDTGGWSEPDDDFGSAAYANDDPFAPATPQSTPNDPFAPASQQAREQSNPYAGGASAGQTQATPSAQTQPESNPYAGRAAVSVGQTQVANGHAGVQAQPGQAQPSTSAQANPYAASQPASAYEMPEPARPKRRKRRAPIVLAVLVVLVALAGAGWYLWTNPPIYDITVNGSTRSVNSGATIQDVIDEGYASPVAGDLIAVDGTIATEGGGDAFEATVDGQAVTDASYVIPRGASVQIDDGNDVDETYTEVTEAIPHGESGGVDIDSASTYYYGPMHVYSSGEDGEQVVKTGDVSGKTVTEVTKQPVDAGYHAYTANVGDEKVIALTFDDGPTAAYTPEILDILKENGAKATFFQIGEQISALSDLEQRIYNEGHQLCTHTWDHASGSGQGVNLTFMTASEQLDEVEKGFMAIEEVLGVQVSRVMRAPGGNYYGSLITNLKDTVTAEIGWSVDTEDWRKPGADSIAQAILSVQPGGVVLMHDGGGDRSQTVEALRTALPQLVAQGYKFVTVDELLAYGMPSSD